MKGEKREGCGVSVKGEGGWVRGGRRGPFAGETPAPRNSCERGTRFAGETLPHGQKRGEQIRCDAQLMRRRKIPEAVNGSRQRACVGVHRRPQEIQQVFTSENFYTGRLVSETTPTNGVYGASLISHESPFQ